MNRINTGTFIPNNTGQSYFLCPNWRKSTDVDSGRNRWGEYFSSGRARTDCISLVTHAIKRHLNCKWVLTGNCETWKHKHITTNIQLDSSKHSVSQMTSIPLGLDLPGYTTTQDKLRLQFNKWKRYYVPTGIKGAFFPHIYRRCYNHRLDGDRGKLHVWIHYFTFR